MDDKKNNKSFDQIMNGSSTKTDDGLFSGSQNVTDSDERVSSIIEDVFSDNPTKTHNEPPITERERPVYSDFVTTPSSPSKTVTVSDSHNVDDELNKEFSTAFNDDEVEFPEDTTDESDLVSSGEPIEKTNFSDELIEEDESPEIASDLDDEDETSLEDKKSDETDENNSIDEPEDDDELGPKQVGNDFVAPVVMPTSSASLEDDAEENLQNIQAENSVNDEDPEPKQVGNDFIAPAVVMPTSFASPEDDAEEKLQNMKAESLEKEEETDEFSNLAVSGAGVGGAALAGGGDQPDTEFKSPFDTHHYRTNRIILYVTIGAIIIILLLLLGFKLFGDNSLDVTDGGAEDFTEQDVEFGPSDDALRVVELDDDSKKLLVNGDILAQGDLLLYDGDFYGRLQVATLTDYRNYIFPDSSGVVCLDSNNCSYGSLADTTQNSLDILQNALDIATNSALIAQNAANIAQHSLAIAQNTLDIALNTSAINAMCPNGLPGVKCVSLQSTAGTPVLENGSLRVAEGYFDDELLVGTTTSAPNAIVSIDGGVDINGHAAIGYDGAEIDCPLSLSTVLPVVCGTNVESTLYVAERFDNNDPSLKIGIANDVVYDSNSIGLTPIAGVGTFNTVATSTTNTTDYGGCGIDCIFTLMIGSVDNASHAGSGDFLGTLMGTVAYAQNIGGGNVSSMIGARVGTLNNGGLVDNQYGLIVDNSSLIFGSPTGTTTNLYGIYVEDQTGLSTDDNYNIYSEGEGGNLFQGHTAIGNIADVDDSTLLDYVLGPSSYDGESALIVAEKYDGVLDKDFYGGANTLVVLDPSADTTALFAAGNASIVIEEGNTSDFSLVLGNAGSAHHRGDGDISALVGQGALAENYGNGNLGGLLGSFNNSTNRGTGDIDNQVGSLIQILNDGSGIVDRSIGLAVRTDLTNVLGTFNNAVGILIDTIGNTGGGTIGNAYGLVIGDQSGVATVGDSFNFISEGDGHNLLQGHTAIGNSAAPNDTNLISTGTTYNSTLTIEEAFTDTLASNQNNITNYMLISAPSDTTNEYRGIDTRLETDFNATNYGDTIQAGSFTATHKGSGDITSSIGGIRAAVGQNAGSSGEISSAVVSSLHSGFFGSGDITASIGQSIGGEHSGLGTVGTSAGLFVAELSGSGAIDDNIGIVIGDMTRGSSTNVGLSIVGAGTYALWIGNGADNTDAANGITFGASADTNLYRGGADVLQTDDALRVADGSVGTPSYSFGSDPDTGFYLSAPGVVSFAGGGTEYWTFGAVGGDISGDGVNTDITGVDVLRANNVRADIPGTAAAPSIGWHDDVGQNTGLYLQGEDEIGITTGGVHAVTIDATGNVAIGATTAGSKLDIDSATASSNVDLFRILSDVGGADNVKFRIDSDGDIFTDGSTTIGTPADVAEVYKNFDGALAGEVVFFTDNRTVAKTTTGYQTGIAGIVSTEPGLILSGNTDGIPVALTGRVPVKVTDENGLVEAGDYLTSSATRPGWAMKATEIGPTLGTAMEPATSTESLVDVWVNTSHYNPTDIQESSSFDISNLNVSGNIEVSDITVSSSANVQNLTVSQNVQIEGNLSVAGTATFGDIIVNGHIVSGGSIPSSSAGASLAEGSVNVDGTDTAGSISIDTTAGSGNGELARINFASTFGSTPRVTLTPTNSAASGVEYFVTKTATGFTVNVSGGLVAGQKLSFDYQVIE